jgi:hypothetical protein
MKKIITIFGTIIFASIILASCGGNSSKEQATTNEVIDQNNKLIPNIGTSSDYIWESINTDAQLYTILAFDDLIFRTSVYLMDNKTNSEDFSKIIDLTGTWIAVDNKNAKGVISTNDVSVNWVFSDDFSSLTNSEGVVFNRTKV